MDLLDKRAVCNLLGGSRPINCSTLYRNIAKGHFPKPIKVAGSSRWLRAEIEQTLASAATGRA
jgi:predicted DNA-binding transcriptional regulator AlpA